MKLNLILLFLVISISSFIFITDHSAATASQEQGYYIFIESKPAAAYEYLGTIENNNWSTYSGSPKALLDKTIQKTKRDYPKADAIIFSDMEMHKADAIKFKE